MTGAPDIALVSLGTTMGLARADEALASQIRSAGASCRLVVAPMGATAHLRKSMALTDLVEGLAARRAADSAPARAVIYSSVTAALLQPPRAPAAVRFDATARLNRPGLGGRWQRRREGAVLARATMLLPWSRTAADSACAAAGPSPPPSVILPAPVAPGPAPGENRSGPDVAAYAADPHKRGLDMLCEAWRAAAPRGARLAVAGIDREQAVRRLGQAGVAEPPGVDWLGPVPHERWLQTVADARLFVSAARHEDWGMAQLEALSAGTPLVTVPSSGANVALPLARELAPALVAPRRTAGDLAAALRVGLAMGPEERRAYAGRAHRLLAPFREEELRRRVAQEVLPVLLG